jgi:hypothetical protein
LNRRSPRRIANPRYTLFVAMGDQRGAEDTRGRLLCAHNCGGFVVAKPIIGKPASNANGGTIGFAMSGPEQPRHSTNPVSRMAARRSRVHPACAEAPPARFISLSARSRQQQTLRPVSRSR